MNKLKNILTIILGGLIVAGTSYAMTASFQGVPVPSSFPAYLVSSSTATASSTWISSSTLFTNLGLGTIATQNANSVSITGGNISVTNSTTTNQWITGVTSSVLATDANGKVIATTTTGLGWNTGERDIEYPLSNENKIIYTFNATSTIVGCLAGNGPVTGNTFTFNVGITSSQGTATSSLPKIFTSDQTVTATTSMPLISVNGSSTANTGQMLLMYTTLASSTNLYVQCYGTTP
jgi:hypothetical protein